MPFGEGSQFSAEKIACRDIVPTGGYRTDDCCVGIVRSPTLVRVLSSGEAANQCGTTSIVVKYQVPGMRTYVVVLTLTL